MANSPLLPERLYAAGITDLVSVIPPNATLAPSSTIPSSAIGKVPGRRLASGLWVGYDWRKSSATLDDVREWTLAGANVGLRADRFPAVDIDTADAALAQIVEDVALATLGPAPVRVGRAPKRLLMYRAAEPFTRMRLFVTKDGVQHLIEILGAGQQYVIHGTHPGTMQPYRWLTEPEALTEISRGKAVHFLDELERALNILSVGSVQRSGDGRVIERGGSDAGALAAPSLELLTKAVALIPNTDQLFPSRDDYIRMGYAIKAAGSEWEEEAYEVFAEWASRHKSDGRVAGNPETWRSDWRRIRPPYAVGWSWIAEQARPHGFEDAREAFEASEAAPPPEPEIEAPDLSDQWLAVQIAARLRAEVRYSPEWKCWLCWDGSRWKVDAELMAEDLIKRELRRVADRVARNAEKRALEDAKGICSAARLSAVMTLVKSDRSIAVPTSVLDNNPWEINTPAGIVDLKTAELRAPDPDALCTKMTAVAPDAKAGCPEWRRFLREATGNDAEMEAYLQRLFGYSLTGITREQQLTFLWGPGGNGKSVAVNAIAGILEDYAVVASMDTFTAHHGERHTTDVAMLAGARLVSASESASGKRWDEQRVKQLSGNEKVTARFMHRNNFTFLPQFKLIFLGNHKPEIRDVDPAMRRRVQMVPFTVTPARVDLELGEKLRGEWPGIFAWMLEGCLAWQQQGLKPPPRVLAATEEYFEQEDAVGRWMEDCLRPAEGKHVTSAELFQSWTEWANANGEWRGTQKRLSSLLVTRGLTRWREPASRRAGFSNIQIVNREGLEFP